MAKISNYPSDSLNAVPSEEVSEILSDILDVSNLGHVGGYAKDDELFRRRAQQYFTFCRDRGLRIGVEGLANACGVTRQTLYNWKRGQGCSQQRQRDVESAYQVIAAYIEQLGISGKLNPAAFVWVTKNWLQYTDSITISAEENTSEYVPSSVEEIKQRYQSARLPEMPVFNEDNETTTDVEEG